MTPTEGRGHRLVLFAAVAALVGLSIFMSLAVRAVKVEGVGAPEALARLAAARAKWSGETPMIVIAADGRVSRSLPPASSGGAVAPLTRLEVLGYRVGDEKLVEAHVPFWFFDLKGGAVQFALRDTGMDIERLGLTAEDLARRGPGLILDEVRPNGDRLLVWTE